MILEVAIFDIVPGQEAAFEAGVGRCRPLFARAKGCHAMSLRRVIEVPGRYQLLVEWDSLEDHTVGFRESEDFQTWRATVGQYFAAAPVVEHSEIVAFAD